jgi:two-component system sensor histidine kinase GlrK
MIGYLLVILLLTIIIAYSLVNLDRMTKIVSAVIYSDQQAVDLERQMVDSFLSLVRNVQKFLVTRDRAFLNLSQLSKAEFLESSRQLVPKLTSDREIELTKRIHILFDDYHSLLEKETDALYQGNSPPAEPGAKEKIAEEITGALNSLANMRQQRIIEKIQGLRETGSRATVMVQALVVVSLFSAAMIAFMVTKGINKPLQRIKKMTTVVSSGDFDQHIDLDSPPELAKLARSFNQMSEKLKQLDEMKSAFISHVSHELRTPLASIKEADNLLLEEAGGEITEKQRRFLIIIEQGTTKLVKMIDDLLDLSKMEAGMMEYDFMPADIRPILAHGLAGVEVLAEKKGLRLRSEVTGSLPLVRMDINKIQQVVDNLLSNAIKYTPEGQSIEVKAEIYPPVSADSRGDREGRFLRVSVSDTGIGIPPEFQARIFDRFQEIKPKQKGVPGTKGTGLGLSIARHIVQAHGGRIWVESVPGKGSTFIFVLPLERKQQAAAPRA